MSRRERMKRSEHCAMTQVRYAPKMWNKDESTYAQLVNAVFLAECKKEPGTTQGKLDSVLNHVW